MGHYFTFLEGKSTLLYHPEQWVPKETFWTWTVESSRDGMFYADTWQSTTRISWMRTHRNNSLLRISYNYSLPQLSTYNILQFFNWILQLFLLLPLTVTKCDFPKSINRKSTVSSWPLRSPDVTLLDFCLFGRGMTRYTVMLGQIAVAIANVTARLVRVRLCAKLQMALTFKCLKDSFYEYIVTSSCFPSTLHVSHIVTFVSHYFVSCVWV